MIAEGEKAPDFELQTDSGESVRLSDLKGKPVVLYFYPKDNTPGCTKEACGIRDAWSEFKRRGAVVLGVSADSVASHERFKAKYHLPSPSSPTASTRSPSYTAPGNRSTSPERAFSAWFARRC